MTLVLTLTPEEKRRIEGAREKGIDVDAMLHGVIASLPIADTDASKDRTIELFAQWAEEDKQRLATMTPEEIAAEDAMWDEIQYNIEHNGLELHIPDMSDHD